MSLCRKCEPGLIDSWVNQQVQVTLVLHANLSSFEVRNRRDYFICTCFNESRVIFKRRGRSMCDFYSCDLVDWSMASASGPEGRSVFP